MTTFVSGAHRYWFDVFPAVRREVGILRRRAEAIPDPSLRRLALDTQAQKWGNLEGAAAFAAFLPSARRRVVARLLVNLQGIYDYADTLMEQPAGDPRANASSLHGAILVALEPGRPHIDYYAHHDGCEDGGYLAALVERCRSLLEELPSFASVAEAARLHARRIVDYQCDVNLASEGRTCRTISTRGGDSDGLTLRWWETAAAGGSSLTVFALLAAAAKPRLTPVESTGVERLYWPFAASLHTLLDNLIDWREDLDSSQHNLLSHYSSNQEMARRLEYLASETFLRACDFDDGHRLILAGMVALYLSDEHAWTSFARPSSERVLSAAGAIVKPALVMLRARRICLG